jgi:hypothetical protein
MRQFFLLASPSHSSLALRHIDSFIESLLFPSKRHPSVPIMAQPDHSSSGQSLHEPIVLKTNDFPIDLTNARIHKYVIKFHPRDITAKEKEFLAKKLVARLDVDRKSSTFVQSGKFELLFPKAESDLEGTFFQIIRLRQRESFEGAVLSYVHRSKTYSKFLTDGLPTLSSKDHRSSAIDFEKDNPSLQVCTVFLEKETFYLDPIWTCPDVPSKLDGSLDHQQGVLLNALDSILQQEAYDTRCVQVHGSKIFDMAGEPALGGPVIELRRGVRAETCMIHSSVIRRITPCTGCFLKSMKLAKFLRLLRSSEDGTGPSLDGEQLNSFLKGMRIKKGWGKKEVVQILGLAAGNADQETFYWNNHTTTTVSNYMHKVHHNKPDEEEKEDLQQRCVVAGSLKGNQTLLPTMCDVVPGQYISLSVDSSYFEEENQLAYRSLLHQGSTTCLSMAAGSSTKLLKCAVSPTVADKFGLNIAGVGQNLVYERNAAEDRDRIVKGEILATQKKIHDKEVVTSDRSVIALVCACSESGHFRDIIRRALHSCKIEHSRVVSPSIHDGTENGARQIIAEQKSLQQSRKTESVAGLPKPLVIGVFRKPPSMGKFEATDREKQQFEQLRGVYGNVKFYCQENGYHFAGTFSRSTLSEKEAAASVEALMRRLETQTRSAFTSVSPSAPLSGPNKILLLGIHVSKVQTQHPKHHGNVEGQQPGPRKQKADCVYLISIAAKVSGSQSHHRVRTFLQQSYTSEQRFAGALAMDTATKGVIQELVGGTSLKSSTLVVFRAGYPPGKIMTEEMETMKVTKLLHGSEDESHELNGDEQSAADLESPGRPDTPGSTHSETEDESHIADSVQNKLSIGYGKGLNSSAMAAYIDAESNSEIGVLNQFASSQKARLLYLTVAANTKARLFDQTGQLLFQERSTGKKKKSANTANGKALSSILVRHPETLSNVHMIDWLLQKRLPKREGHNTPLLLKGYAFDEDIGGDDSVREALSKECWDFPRGTWSSKSLSCVTLAKKANRHATRIIRLNEKGEPVLPKVHPDLKESLYFI